MPNKQQYEQTLRFLNENPELAVEAIYKLKKEKEEFFFLAEELLNSSKEYSRDLFGNQTVHLILTEKRYNEIFTQLYG